MHVEVSDDDHLPARKALFCFQPRNYLCRQEVSADDQIGLIAAQEFDEWTCVELVECKTAAFVLPRLVEFVVNPTRHFREFVYEIDVGFRIEVTKDFIRVVENVEVMNFPALAVRGFFKRFLNRLRGAHMSRASGGR